MALSTAVFDSNVFDVGTFEALEITPALYKVVVEKVFRKVVPGQSLSMYIYIKNIETTPGRSLDYNPGETPQVEIYTPSGTIKQAFTNMYNISTGVYGYQHTVGVSDVVGAYTARFKALNGGKVMLSPKIVMFEVMTVS